MSKLKLKILCCSLLLAGCATESYQIPDTYERSANAPPVLNIVESRSMYLFSLARIHALEGDYDGALTLTQASIEADPQSAFLHASVAELYLKLNRLQEAINASIADPLVKDLTVSLQQGYIQVTGQRQRLNDASKTDTLNFRLDLGVSNGQLTATVSDATLDGKPVEQSRVDHWNQTIASRIVIIGKKRPNTSLKSVSIMPGAVTMDWTVSK